MSDTTTNRGYTKPVITDNILDLLDMAVFADEVDADIQALTGLAPVGDSSNSVTLTSGDVRLTQSAQTTILSATFTLTRQQWVQMSAKARIDNSGGAAGAVGVHCAVDGTVHPLSHAGPIQVEIDAGLRNQITTGIFSQLLGAGSHTVLFRANRDANGTLDAVASGTLSTGPTYHSTALIITV